TIEIARKAINIAIEKDNSCIFKFLKEYIVQNEHSFIENTTGESSLGQETNIFEEHSELSTISERPSIIVSNPIKKTRKACQNENRVSDLTTICELCGGHDHKKEMHNNKFMKINESDRDTNDKNEWVSSCDSESEAGTDCVE
ncbi:23058_t:CDS:2, partial [Racocetra persica]